MTSTGFLNPRHLKLILVAVVVLAIGAPSIAAAGEWSADSSHTAVNFSIKHFFTPVTGSFDEFEVDLDYNADEPEKSSVTAKIKVASVNTGNEKRDNHLRTADWFESDEHPWMTFESTSVRKSDDGQLIAAGPLTIKGISHQVELPITVLGVQEIPAEMQEMFGGTRKVASFQGETTISRNDFEVGVGNWAATMVVGGDVDIEILLEAHSK